MSASIFRVNKKEEPSREVKKRPAVFSSVSPEKERGQPSDYEISDEDIERMGEKGQAEALSRVLEGTLGLPGNLASLANKLTGGKIKSVSGLAQHLPGTEQLKEASEKYSQGYTKSEGKLNEIAGEYLQDVGAYLPLSAAGFAAGTGSKAVNFLRTWQPFISPFLGQNIKQSAKAMGSGEGWQEGLKLATMVTFDILANRGRGAQGYIGNLFDEASKALPKGVRTGANNLRSSLLRLESDLQKGGTSPDKSAALTKIQEVLGKMITRGKNHFIDVTELPAFRKSINSVREQLGGWKSELPPGVKRKAIKNLESVKSLIIDAGMGYGKRSNPQFAKYWQAANEASNVYSKSNFAMKFLNKVVGEKMLGKIMGGLAAGHLGHTALAGKSVLGTLAHTAAATGSAASVGVPLYNFSKVVYRMSKSPQLRSYYTNLFKSAVKEDAGQVSKYANKIEKKEKQDEIKEKNLVKSILRD